MKSKWVLYKPGSESVGKGLRLGMMLCPPFIDHLSGKEWCHSQRNPAITVALILEVKWLYGSPLDFRWFIKLG